MLILVGVSITVAINGGLFGTAKNAKDRTKTAVKAEQKLANGRIKIGDNFYASINDYPDNPIYTASVGDFVQYDVAYTDVYINQAYTNKNGWRILRYET
ncbi:MAG: hypothetical protein Q4G09_07290, partial [Clostridia bacterium]|nr:hypothetical protein [Clostridia bacterium]